MFKKFAQEILKKVTKGKGKPKPKPKPKPKKKTQAGAQSRKGGQTSPTTGQKAALGVAAAGTGALTGLKLKQGKDAGAAPKVSGQGQSPKGGTAPKKKPKPSKKLPDARDKAKTRDQVKPGLFVKTKKGFLKDKTGKRVKRLSREELMKRRKAQR